MTATNSEGNQNVYTVSSISGTVTPSGSAASAVAGLELGFYGADNTLSNTASGYSTSTYWS
jgi:hypothetical protein